ncbi:MAG: insulinase family protein [Acidobacteriales bacterium]|nr:insulinase family protein [Terriglobales bacterium]
MKSVRRVVAFILCCLASAAWAQQWPPSVQTRKLPNGLTVVVSEDHTAPTFGLCIAYGIGFRLEPQGRTGFAHLFEHMMFEGTPNAPKGTFDRVLETGGGVNNGDTRYDFTEYIEGAPISALDPTLWLEADRMKTLDFSISNLDNQRKVVEEEVRVNVLNQPYGGFYFLDLPMNAFTKWPNSHNFYGDFKDLDAASIEDVKNFYLHFYAPNNAVLAIVGDVSPQEVFNKVEKYFAAIPSREVPPKPDFAEPPQAAEKRITQTDKLAKVPALAIGYQLPPPRTHDALVAAVTGDLLHNGEASRLYQTLVKEKKVATSVDGGANWSIGSPFEYAGPALMTSFVVYPANVKDSAVMDAYDQVVAQLASAGPSPEELKRVQAKMRSDWYAQLESPISRASALAHAALIYGDPNYAFEVPDELAKVTPKEVQAYAAKYLVKNNRTVIVRTPEQASAQPSKGGQ